MLSPQQKLWINHLNDTDKIRIIPFDPTCEEKFSRVKSLIQNILGPDQPVHHLGASSLGISGQDEIDVYIPVPPIRFDAAIVFITNLFGKPKSNYPLKRARFATTVDTKHIDVFVINQDDAGWKDGLKFHSYLLSNPWALDEYRQLKEKSAGLSTREYYRKKIKFINQIISKISSKT
jgi:GrpB-like predicted nucleotidyltransferase (UPF0157 family)